MSKRTFLRGLHSSSVDLKLEIQKIRDWTTTYVVTVTDCITILPINTLFVTIGGRLDVIGWD